MSFSLPQASANAAESDWLIGGLLIVSLAVLALVFGLMLVYVIRFRAGSSLRRGHVRERTFWIEIGWTTATLVAFFGMFLWGANLYVREFQSPRSALRISVVGKQWMWKVEHEGGQREIDALHVPTGRPIQLVMTSEDVIHDFSVPAFRLKHDVLPGRYETLWFTAIRPGSYHLFCTQLCGTDHSLMIGEVVAMPPAEYEGWLARVGTPGGLVAQGRSLFMRYGCSGCHGAEGSGGVGTVRAPPLRGLYGSPVPLSDGTVVTADDQYIRDSILQPARQVVASYPPLMPSFAGQVSEEELVTLVAYIKSLAAPGVADPAPDPAVPASAAGTP